MPPSPGKIQSLPVKVLYTIDTSPQSYVTVLSERQDIYVHPTTSSSAELLGSCALKPLTRAICFASPECVPNQSTLDFSVYNLDPSANGASGSASTSTERAFPAPAPTSTASWTGKGFLSWALSEQGPGNTLTRGRLVREYEFSPGCFVESGGLEGLMAAAVAGGNSGGENADGKGWGLEVTLTLRQLNPEGKTEFSGRKAFEDMLAEGKSTASGPIAVVSSPTRPSASSPSRPGAIAAAASSPVAAAAARTTQPSTSHTGGGFARPAPPAKTYSPLRKSTAASQLPTRPPPPQQPLSPRRTPMERQRPEVTSPSPSRRRAVPLTQRMDSLTATSAAGSASGSGSTTQAQSASASTSQARTGSPATSRETTPPRDRGTPTTLANQLKTPPPPSPSRAALMSLLKSEGKMSPDMARKLASNQFLVRLLKALPPGATADASGSISALGSPVRTGSSSTIGPARDKPQSTGTGGVSSPRLLTAASTPSVETCYNCGASESQQWMSRKLKDGSVGRVCYACGLYFNQHKRMRPAELWGKEENDIKGSSAPGSVAGPSTSGSGSATVPGSGSGSHSRNGSLSTPAVPIRQSPRLNRTRPAPTDDAAPPESPRKRQRSKPVPPPSPRMATRASARAAAASSAGNGDSTTTPGATAASGRGGVDFTSHFPFSSGAAGAGGISTSGPMVNGTGNNSHSGTGGSADPNGLHADGNGEVDLEALFLQFGDDDEVTVNGTAEGQPGHNGDINLEALFGAEGDTEGLLELLKTIESDAAESEG